MSKKFFNFPCFALVKVSVLADGEIDEVDFLGFYRNREEADREKELRRTGDLWALKKEAKRHWELFGIPDWEESHPCRDAYVIVDVSNVFSDCNYLYLFDLNKILEEKAILEFKLKVQS